MFKDLQVYISNLSTREYGERRKRMSWKLRKNPNHPMWGVRPVQPVKPVQPIKPIQPVKPVRPVKPVAPEGYEYYWVDD